MEGVSSMVKLLSSFARVKQFFMASNDPQQFMITSQLGLQKALRIQYLQGVMQTLVTDFF